MSWQGSTVTSPKERRKIGVNVIVVDLLSLLQEAHDGISCGSRGDFVKHLECVERHSCEDDIFRGPDPEKTNSDKSEGVQCLAHNRRPDGPSPKMAASCPKFHLG